MRAIFCICCIATVLLAGCGGGGGSSATTGATARADLTLTPAGTGQFVQVGETGISVNTAPVTVQTPTLLRFTRFPTPIGLTAPIPVGFGFVAAADIRTVESNQPQTVLAAPVILRIPVTGSLPEGRKLLILIANDTDRVPVFRPLLTTGGQPVQATLMPDGTAEFSTAALGSFAIVTQN